jgi:hypothetical protein
LNRVRSNGYFVVLSQFNKERYVMKALRNALLCALFVSGNALAATAGLFQVPYDTSAGTYGWEGYHMIWYEDDGAGNLIQGYHMGEDWNRGSGSADEGIDSTP